MFNLCYIFFFLIFPSFDSSHLSIFVGNFLVDLEDKPSEKSKTLPNFLGPTTDHLSPRREHLSTGSKESALPMKTNFVADGLRSNGKGMSHSPLKFLVNNLESQLTILALIQILGHKTMHLPPRTWGPLQKKETLKKETVIVWKRHLSRILMLLLTQHFLQR